VIFISPGKILTIALAPFLKKKIIYRQLKLWKGN